MTQTENLWTKGAKSKTRGGLFIPDYYYFPSVYEALIQFMFYTHVRILLKLLFFWVLFRVIGFF